MKTDSRMQEYCLESRAFWKKKKTNFTQTETMLAYTEEKKQNLYYILNISKRCTGIDSNNSHVKEKRKIHIYQHATRLGKQKKTIFNISI